MSPNDKSLHDRCLHVCWYTPASTTDKTFLGMAATKLWQHRSLSKADRERAEAICSKHGQVLQP